MPFVVATMRPLTLAAPNQMIATMLLSTLARTRLEEA